MKLAALVVVVSTLLSCGVRAEDANPKNQPAGSCMPIGLTASGELVFPWDCRAIIEKQRGPVSVNVPSPSSEPSAKDQAQDGDAAPAQAATPASQPPQQPQIAAAADHVAPSSQDAAAASVRAVPHLRAKRALAALPDRKRQMASQPVSTSASPPAATGTTSIKSLFSR